MLVRHVCNVYMLFDTWLERNVSAIELDVFFNLRVDRVLARRISETHNINVCELLIARETPISNYIHE